MACESGGTAGDDKAVVARQAEVDVEELVELLVVAAVGAVDGDSADAFALKGAGWDEAAG